jgi:hypothetical protein
MTRLLAVPRLDFALGIGANTDSPAFGGHC